MNSKIAFWTAFIVFVAAALYFDRQPSVVQSRPGKYVVWAAFAAFLGYSLYCSARENLFRSIKKMAELHWGRQVGIDLYLGLALMLSLVYLNERSALVCVLW